MVLMSDDGQWRIGDLFGRGDAALIGLTGFDYFEFLSHHGESLTRLGAMPLAGVRFASRLAAWP